MSVLVILDLWWIKVKVFDKLAWNKALFHHEKLKTYAVSQGSGNFEIWIGPADDDDVINEPISPQKNMYISPVTKTNDNWQSYNSF